MAELQSRSDLATYCLNRLGQGIVEINITADQIDDRISDALQFFTDYHCDATDKVYFKHLVTAQDVANKWFYMPPEIMGAVEIFPIGQALSTNNIFNIRYQIALNDMYDLTAVSMVPYYTTFQYVQMMEQMLVGQQPIRFNRHTSKLHVDMDWGRIAVGQYIIVVAYKVLDPDEYTSLWNDRMLKKYATALMKVQWGENLIKYKEFTMPGGSQFNGEKIYNDGVQEVKELEQEIINSYSLPASDLIL